MTLNFLLTLSPPSNDSFMVFCTDNNFVPLALISSLNCAANGHINIDRRSNQGDITRTYNSSSGPIGSKACLKDQLSWASSPVHPSREPLEHLK